MRTCRRGVSSTDQGYRLVPYVFEFRSVIDWTVTKTTLTFGQWLKIEDIYASNYDIKSCTRRRLFIGWKRGPVGPLTNAERQDTDGGAAHADRELQKRQKRQVGDTQSALEQWATGLLVLAGLVILVWFPLIILATPGTTTINPPVSMRISISAFGAHPPDAAVSGRGPRREGGGAASDLTLDEVGGPRRSRVALALALQP